VMPETTGAGALERVAHAQALVGSAITRGCRLTFSCGVYETADTTDAAELLRLADAALYWSKANGRDRAQLYHPAPRSAPVAA